MATSAVRTSVAAGTSVTAGREGRVAPPLPMRAHTLASLSSTESRPSWVMQALKKRAVLRARRDLQTSADFVRWLSWPNGARAADQTASQSKSAPEVGRRRASVPACSSTQPAADHVWPPSAEIDVGAVLMPGCRHREAAGGQSGPDLASHRKKSQSGEALSSEIGVKADSWPPAGDGRRPMRSAGLMLDSDLEKNSKYQSTAIGDRGRCRLTMFESRPSCKPSASVIGRSAEIG